MIPNLSKTAFWDINFDELDEDKNVVFIMEKMFNYGLWNDQLAVIRFYGRERNRKEVIKGAYFKKKVLNFLCVIFDLQPADFTHYTYWQSLQQYWEL